MNGLKGNHRPVTFAVVLALLFLTLSTAVFGCGGKKGGDGGNGGTSSGTNITGKPRFILFTQPG